LEWFDRQSLLTSRQNNENARWIKGRQHSSLHASVFRYLMFLIEQVLIYDFPLNQQVYKSIGSVQPFAFLTRGQCQMLLEQRERHGRYLLQALLTLQLILRLSQGYTT